MAVLVTLMLDPVAPSMIAVTAESNKIRDILEVKLVDSDEPYCSVNGEDVDPVIVTFNIIGSMYMVISYKRECTDISQHVWLLFISIHTQEWINFARKKFCHTVKSGFVK